MIRVHDLSKRYGEVRAVNGVSFDIARGEVVGFLGPNGAGKSTTMKILTGYLAADSGVAEIDGHDVADSGLEARGHIGYLPESTPLYRGMRVDRYLDWVGQVRGMARRTRRDALERVVSDCDLDGYTGRRIGALSKGYRQRVGLAQALFSDPDVLILDEPTSGLDPAEIVRIRDLVARLGRDKTVLLSTHVLGEARETCQRVLILAGGRLVADGSPDGLADEEGAALRVVLRGEPDLCRRTLEGVVGSETLREARSTGEDRCAFQVDTNDLDGVAADIAKAVVKAGLELCELRHDLPSLERVFLQRTSPQHVDGSASGPFAGGDE